MEGRILKQMPAELRVKMDALVHDLTQALEETSCSSSVRIKVGVRRRARSTGNLGTLTCTEFRKKFIVAASSHSES